MISDAIRAGSAGGGSGGKRTTYCNPERPDVYGYADCVECRSLTPRRLPSRFPHICSGCLFGGSLEATQADRLPRMATKGRRRTYTPRFQQ